MLNLMEGGNGSGWECSFSSSSSIRFIFHLRRFNCQVPRAKVNIGIMPRSTIVGVSHGSCRAL